MTAIVAAFLFISPGPTLVLVAPVLLVTALWHAIAGKSWMTRLWKAGGRKTAAAGAGLAVVALVAGATLLPPADTAPAEAAPETTAAATTHAVTPEPEEAPSATEATTAATPTPTPSVEATPEPAPTVEAISEETPTPTAPSTIGGASDGTLATVLLSELAVKGRAPKTGYSRDEFGQRWKDVDRNGCDQRNDILDRDLTNKTYKPGTRDCVVETGTLADPFTGTIIDFVRGEGTSNAVQIDHVVALSDAWQKGAQQLTPENRALFANDPLNLLAVDGPSNGSKGDGDAATWLPPHRPFRCDYVARQVAVKHKYLLWVTQAEHDAIARILSDCPGQTVPASDLAPEVSATPAAPTTTQAAPATSVEAPVTTQAAPHPAEPDADVYYKNCTEVREAGKAPILRGEPGYRSGLDRDNDGVACE